VTANGRLLLPVDQPLDLAATLQSGQAFRWRADGDAWSGFLGADLVALRQVDDGVEVRCLDRARSTILGRVARYLRMDDDLPAIYRRLRRDPHLAWSIEQHPGLRLLRQEPWECLIAFICSTQSNIPRISRIQEALADAMGTAATLDGVTRSAFPTPEALAGAGEERLRGLGLGYRAAFVARAAEVVATGRLRLDALAEASYQDARAALMSVHGVGEKVADCVLLFSMDRMESFPIDRWVRRAVEERYFGGRTMPLPVLASWARETFGPVAGYAQQYLFYGRRLGLPEGGPPPGP
jgi:N-glycosylase/DNA lyase